MRAWRPIELGVPVTAPAVATDEVAAVFDQARRDGYAEGRAAGQAAVVAEASRLAGLVEALDTDLRRIDQAVGVEVLELALELARQMVRQALVIRPELVLPLVRDALALLPLSEGARLALHPDDAQLVRQHLAEPIAHGHWRIDEDHHLERGECRVETATNLVDGQFATRWETLGAALGQRRDWLAHEALV